MVKHFPQARVRLPPDVMKYVEEEAHEASSSKNSVIVRAIRTLMKTKGPAATAIAPDLNTTHP